MNRIIFQSLHRFPKKYQPVTNRLKNVKYLNRHSNSNSNNNNLNKIILTSSHNSSLTSYCNPSNAGIKYFSSSAAEEIIEESFTDKSSNQWTPESRRTGALALKVGMVAIFDKWGKRWPCTALYLDNCKVTQVKTPEKEGFSAVQVGIGHKKLKNTTLPLKGHFDKAKVDPRRKLSEFRVTDDAIVPVGTEISARHFVPGQYVDVIGTSIGKGFQGVMKRYGFKGQRATHGVSKTHRQMGSTGQSQGPGRVFKNKKMPGRMGGKQVTAQCLIVHQVDPAKNLVYVRGSIPGHKGNYVKIQDTKKNWGKRAFKEAPPFPTFIPNDENTDGLETLVVEAPEEDFFGYR